MAVIETTRTSSAAAGIGARLWHAASIITATLVTWAADRKHGRALASLTEAQLDDLGLCRADILDMQRARR